MVLSNAFFYCGPTSPPDHRVGNDGPLAPHHELAALRTDGSYTNGAANDVSAAPAIALSVLYCRLWPIRSSLSPFVCLSIYLSLFEGFVASCLNVYSKPLPPPMKAVTCSRSERCEKFDLIDTLTHTYMHRE